MFYAVAVPTPDGPVALSQDLNARDPELTLKAFKDGVQGAYKADWPDATFAPGKDGELAEQAAIKKLTRVA